MKTAANSLTDMLSNGERNTTEVYWIATSLANIGTGESIQAGTIIRVLNTKCVAWHIAKPLHCDWEFVILFLLLIVGLPKSLTVSSLTGLVDKEEVLVR